MQETAWNALKNWGPPPEYLRENNIAFILAKISFKYYEEIYEDDIIKIETWANPAKGLIFPRNYRIYKDGKPAAEAVSAWVLLDTKEKDILRPEVLDKNFTAYDDEELGFAVQKRFKMPDGMDICREYKVRYSDIDTYCHMNNAAYIDLICDNLYADGDIISPELKKRLISLDVNYNSEARFAQTIEINIGQGICSCREKAEEKEYYFRAKVKGAEQNCFEAKAVVL
jgi:acyl-ACP thioesterase